MSKQARIRSKIAKETLICKPLVNFNDIHVFLDDPPPWRSLCKELTPHSNFVIRNIEQIGVCEPSLELPETFCHIDPDADAPVRYDITKKKLPKTLVCHDMANGYHDDSKIEGSVVYDTYTFYNWAGIDIFCYFSHHFITIPPVGWINVGHAHGVKVIGTIITEWGEGAQLWEGILHSEMEYKHFASAVVAIAKTMKFDGWLLNIENKITQPDELLNFVRYLHRILHEELVDPLLIWYDSVTVTGNLNWQNGLNAKNKEFFDICDGLFTNYSWTVKDVEDSAKVAGDRLTDLYIGIDVWGRNFHGGGQFNVQEAVKIAHEQGCSLAIFAPAWTREAINSADPGPISTPEHYSVFEEFLLRDRALWDSLWPFLNTHLPSQLPFQTSFCRGQGKKRWMYGEVVSPGPWYNLRHQQYQPNCAHGPHGYVLSTMARLKRLSHPFKTEKGILKYRQELQNIRSTEQKLDPEVSESSEEEELHFKTVTDEHIESARLEKIKHHNQPVDPITVHPPLPETQEKSIDPPPAKRKKLPFKQLVLDKCDKIKTLFKKRETLLDPTTTNSIPEWNPTSGTSGKELTVGIADDPKDTTSPEAAAASTTSMKPPGNLTNLEAPSMVTVSVNIDLNKSAVSTRWALGHVTAERECLQMWLDDAFCGGSCIKVNPSDKISTEHRTTRLFQCDFYCPDTLIVCVVTKDLVQAPDQYLNVKLAMVNSNGRDLTIVMDGRPLGLTGALSKDSSGIIFVYPLISEEQEDFRKLREYLLLNESGFYIPIDNINGWRVKYYVVRVPGARVLEVRCRAGLPQGGILLGHLGICHRNMGQPQQWEPPAEYKEKEKETLNICI